MGVGIAAERTGVAWGVVGTAKEPDLSLRVGRGGLGTAAAAAGGGGAVGSVVGGWPREVPRNLIFGSVGGTAEVGVAAGG